MMLSLSAVIDKVDDDVRDEALGRRKSVETSGEMVVLWTTSIQ